MWLLVAANGEELLGTGDEARSGGGVILWASDHSATESFAGSAMKTLGLKYCNGKRQEDGANGFDSKLLAKCMKKRKRFAHMNPHHLAKNELTASVEFFEAAKEANFSVVVALRRENELNQKLSTFEMHADRKVDSDDFYDAAASHFCDVSLKDEFRRDLELWKLGIQDAVRAGFEPLVIDFVDATEQTCESVNKMLQLMPEYSENALPCVHSREKKTRKAELTVEERVGPVAYTCIKDQLEEDPEYSWMLESEAELPPY